MRAHVLLLVGMAGVIAALTMFRVVVAQLPEVNAPDEDPVAKEINAAAKLQDDPAHQAELAKHAAAADRLIAARHAAYEELTNTAIADYQSGKGSLATALDSLQRLAAAESDASTTPAERLAAREKLLRSMSKLEVRAKELNDKANAPSTDYLSVKAARLDAEIARDREQIGRNGTPAEIKVLREAVDSRAITFNIAHSRYKSPLQTVDFQTFAKAACELCLARADLALAQADKPAAIDQLKLALKNANRRVEMLKVSVASKRKSADVVTDAAEDRYQIELKLLELSPDAVEEVHKAQK